jgi:hypothetical protein
MGKIMQLVGTILELCYSCFIKSTVPNDVLDQGTA